MDKDVRIFDGHKIVLDVDSRLLKSEETREVWNCISNVPTGGNIGCISNGTGQTSIFDLPINATFLSQMPKTIFKGVGACKDEQNKAIIALLCDTIGTNHCIIRYYTDTKKCEFVLNSQANLNFQSNLIISCFVINGILYFTDNFETVPFLKFNPPRQLNIIRAVGYTNPYDINKEYHKNDYAGYQNKTYQWVDTLPGKSVTPTNPNPAYWSVVDLYGFVGTPPPSYPAYNATTWYYYGDKVSLSSVNYQYINPFSFFGITPPNANYWKVLPSPVYGITLDILKRIKPCPSTQPTAVYDSDVTVFRNNLRGFLFQFAVRWVYADNEKSVFGAWSPIPFPVGEEFLMTQDVIHGGNPGNFYLNEVTANNVIKVGVDTGGENVIAMEVAVNAGDYSLWKLAVTINKFDENGGRLVDDYSSVLYNFYNDTSNLVLDNNDFYRLYDFVPQVSGFETPVEDNRILDCNYIEGFDNIITNNKFNVTTQKIANIPSGVSQVATWVPQGEAGIPGFPENAPDYFYCNLDITPFPATLTVGTVIECTIYRFTYLVHGGSAPPPPGDTTGSVPLTVAVVVSPTDTKATIVSRLGALINAKISSGYTYNGVLQNMYFYFWRGHYVPQDDLAVWRTTVLNSYPDSTTDEYVVQKMVVSYVPAIVKIPALKSGATHYVGIEYADDDMRLVTVQKTENDRFFIPFLADEFGVSGDFPALLTPFHKFNVSWQVFHRPHVAAKWWRWVYGGMDISYELQFAIKINDIVTQGVNSSIQINKYLLTTASTFPMWNVENYQWKKGDRIRFLLKQTAQNVDTSYVYFAPHADFEILNMTYYASSGDWWQKDVAGSGPVYDGSGNKIPDTGYLSILVPYIDKVALGINTHSQQEYIVFEVYRPKQVGQSGAITVYDECENWNPVIDPHLPTRSHGNLSGLSQSADLVTPASGTFSFGNIYVKIRMSAVTNFFCEAQEFSDYYDSTVVSTGRSNLYFPGARRIRNTTNILYGGQLIQGTLSNEISKVLSTDSVTLRQDFGPIAYAAQVGFTLKIIQRSKQTSFYVGREGLQQATLEHPELITESSSMLSKPIVDEDEYGTIFLAGRFHRNLYFFDIYTGCILRCAPNGTYPISKYGIESKIRNLSQQYIADGVENIIVNIGIDETFNLVIFSFVDTVNPKYNWMGAFLEGGDAWISFYEDTVECFGNLGSVLVSVYNGKLWLHNSGDRLNYHGIHRTAKVTIVSNKNPLTVKRFLSTAQSATTLWASPNMGDISIPVTDTWKRGMQSLLKAGKYISREGKFLADFMKNALSHSNTPKVSDLVDGDDLKGQVLEMTVYNDDTTESKLFSQEINFIESK